MSLDASRPERAAVEVERIGKRYATVQAVSDLSFTVVPGEILGLLGPNGAGKTTTIRMILDIIQPDQGTIRVLGGPMTESTKGRIGYLPEERGLYEDMRLLEVLLFLGQLKGLSRRTARERAEEYLRQVALWEARNSKIEALSRGMRQKAQFVAATMHEPDLIIIDEPFSGLDPLNVRLIRDLLYHLRDRGAAIIMSSHQMQQVEAMCGRILLIDHGRAVLYGSLAEIRRQFAGNAIHVGLTGLFNGVPGVECVVPREDGYHMLLGEGVRPEEVLRALVNTPGVTVERFEPIQASLDEIFVRVVGRPIAEDEVTPSEMICAQDAPDSSDRTEEDTFRQAGMKR